MKSLKELSLALPEEAYHDYPAWSYSVIAKYAKEGFASIPTLHDRMAPTPAMQFGSLFDSVITKGKATKDEYAVCSISIPEAERKAIDYISSNTSDSVEQLEDIPEKDLMRYCDECGYQGRWGYSARLSHLTPYNEYYSIKRSGKKIVSQEDWDDAVEMYKNFRNDEYLRSLFGTKSTDDIEYIYQAQFKHTFVTDKGRTVTLKIMPDLLKVDHKNKTLQPVDLKTSAMPAYQFKDNFIKYRYDIQASLYSDVLRMVMDDIEEYKDYTILPYLFTDISRSDKVPVTYVYDQTDISQIEGLCFTSGDRTYQYSNWKSLLDEIIDYEESNAVVPNYIKTSGPNDMITLLNH